MKQIGLVFNGVWSQYAMATAPKYRDIYELIYVHEMDYERIHHLKALVIPFQSNQEALVRQKDALYRFLSDGKKIAVFGDSLPLWLDAQWEDRPVNNYWWVKDPNKPPISETNYEHPVYRGLQPRHACWHVHGVYTRIPGNSEVVQRNDKREIITWQTARYGGVLFASTLDPIVEHGIQQIRHLDNYVDKLTAWLCGTTPSGPFEVDPAAYGVSEVSASHLTASVH